MSYTGVDTTCLKIRATEMQMKTRTYKLDMAKVVYIYI
jgi:hypothetical protein